MPDPQDKNGVQRFLGMINYLSPQKASLTDPLRQIIKDNAPWNWGQQQSKAMEKLKKILSSGILLTYYDDKKHCSSKQMLVTVAWEHACSKIVNQSVMQPDS